jgi:hypothetical protein
MNADESIVDKSAASLFVEATRIDLCDDAKNKLGNKAEGLVLRLDELLDVYAKPDLRKGRKRPRLTAQPVREAIAAGDGTGLPPRKRSSKPGRNG